MQSNDFDGCLFCSGHALSQDVVQADKSFYLILPSQSITMFCPHLFILSLIPLLSTFFPYSGFSLSVVATIVFVSEVFSYFPLPFYHLFIYPFSQSLFWNSNSIFLLVMSMMFVFIGVLTLALTRSS